MRKMEQIKGGSQTIMHQISASLRVGTSDQVTHAQSHIWEQEPQSLWLELREGGKKKGKQMEFSIFFLNKILRMT